MRRSVVLLAGLALVSVAMTSGAAGQEVKIYLSVGQGAVAGSYGASQIWRCDRDGSNPELLYDAHANTIGGLAVDPSGEKLYYSEDGLLYMANLDLSDPLMIDSAVGGWEINNYGSGHGAVVVTDGYVCWQRYINTAGSCKTDGSDVVYLSMSDWPGLVSNPMIVGVALDTTHESPTEESSWGELKGKYKQ